MGEAGFEEDVPDHILQFLLSLFLIELRGLLFDLVLSGEVSGLERELEL